MSTSEEAPGQPEQEEIESLLLGLAQREYRKCCEVEELTGQMAEALDRDDQVAMGMLLRMRGEAMNEIGKIRRDREILLKASGGSRKRFEELERGSAPLSMTKGEERIFSLAKGRREALRRAQQFDRRVSARLAGDRSFYSN